MGFLQKKAIDLSWKFIKNFASGQILETPSFEIKIDVLFSFFSEKFCFLRKSFIFEDSFNFNVVKIIYF